MTGPDEIDLTGPPDDRVLASTDALLDRLGRRAPGPSDLDDPVSAALAVLAGDADLNPVSVTVTRTALLVSGVWPLQQSRADLATPPEPVITAFASVPLGRLVPEPTGHLEHAPADVVRPVDPVVGAPIGLGPRRARREQARREQARREQARREQQRWPGRAPARRANPGRTGESPRPRILRIRPTVGVAAATALVVLGGGVSAAFTGDASTSPFGGLVTMVSRLTGQTSSTGSHPELSAAVEQARTAVRQGKPAVAQQLIDKVRGQLATLPSAERQALNTQIDSVMSQIVTSDGSAAGQPGTDAEAPGTAPTSEYGGTTSSHGGSAPWHGSTHSTGQRQSSSGSDATLDSVSTTGDGWSPSTTSDSITTTIGSTDTASTSHRPGQQSHDPHGHGPGGGNPGRP